ncbi:hypothetical protein Back2_05730 [Nocardioides baekrokdamisoli]|uniref:Lipoprotein n=1 Tax=Nocardioides baekrokdamisoli TaxID=1804624 RepID=A0A3G9ID49_9ACTN|nr:hypothetical protein Back2_05730 [Nocardioides baekrokdamisoli]
MMRSVPVAATAALLGLTAACGGSPSASRFTVPVGAPPSYLGPATASYVTDEGQTYVDPPSPGVAPHLTWPQLEHQLCHQPGGPSCHDAHARIVVRLASISTKYPLNIHDGPPRHLLMYVVTTTGIRCDSIAVGGTPGWNSKRWPTWCQGTGFINASGAELPRWGGVGPMPGQ